MTPEQIRQGWRLACQLAPVSDVTVEIVDPGIAWRELGEDEYAPVLVRSVSLGGSEPLSGLGIAVDLGTTQIRTTVWDMSRRCRLGGCCGPNPQSGFGEDVLARLEMASRSREDAVAVGRLARDAIGDAIGNALQRAQRSRSEIRHVIIVGNTAMLALLTESDCDTLLQPGSWSRRIDCRIPDSLTWASSWGVPQGARIEVVSPLGGFVGSDLLADVWATAMTGGTTATLLLDVGTNTEIALWDGEALRVTSTPGGPAFEGCGTDFGMPAEPGAVSSVRPGTSSNDFSFDVIGDSAPRGLCGSALVDVIADLVRDGRLKRTGAFAREVGGGGVVVVEGPPRLVLRGRDVDSFQRAKAAIGAATQCLLDEAGVSPSALGRVCVCGAFGRFLDVANSQELGLLPTGVSDAGVELWGNAALAGCEMLLFAPEVDSALRSVREKARLINLALVPEFDDRFIESLRLEPLRESVTTAGEGP